MVVTEFTKRGISLNTWNVISARLPTQITGVFNGNWTF